MSDDNGIPEFHVRDEEQSEPLEPDTEPDNDGLEGDLDELESEWSDSPPGAEPETSRKSKLIEALRNTEPHQDLGDVDNPWNPEEGGVTRIYRGLQKLSGIEGTEAWMDITIGILEWMSLQNDEPINGDSGESTDSTDDLDMVPVE